MHHYANPGLFLNIFIGDPKVDALIIGVCKVCLIIGQALGGGTI